MTIALDKTGTLTEGRPVLSRVSALDGSVGGEALAAALERRSEHPLAYEILSAAGDRGAVLPTVAGFRSLRHGHFYSRDAEWPATLPQVARARHASRP